MPKPIVSGPYRTFYDLNPDETYMEFETSTISIRMRARKAASEPWMDEMVKLRAYMRLEIYPPYVNELGTREFQFTIRDWELTGKSPMLNELFFDDPRGQLVENRETGGSDYVPAIVTWTLSHNYYVGVDDGQDLQPSEIFGSEKAIEIRNLTSHDLRVWSSFQERAEPVGFYNYQNNRIYWQVIPGHGLGDETRRHVDRSLAQIEGKGLEGDHAVIVFHKKAPGIPGETDEFDVNNAQDRARYMLAASSFTPHATRMVGTTPWTVLRAGSASRGLEANTTRMHGNTILSSHNRARQPLEIFMPLAGNIRGGGEVNELVSRHFEGTKKPYSGWIQIVRPPRCLATAEQGPLPGEPIDSADFPARITYTANYHIYINRERLVEDQSGIAFAVGALEIPPRDVRVAFQKPEAGHVLNSYIDFRAGACSGMEPATMEAFHEGANYARYWRTVPLDREGVRTLAGEGGFADYDPARAY